MRDRIFEGPDKEAALQKAAETLGVPAAELRHVVLEERAGHAQVAVLGVSEARHAKAPGPVDDDDYDDDEDYVEEDPAEGIREVVAALSRAADLEVSVEIEDGKDRMLARLSGADASFFTADDGRALTALEYLLQRTYGELVEPRKILVDADGYREQREAGLRRLAEELAEGVRGDGETRSTQPLNSYERRIVHMTVADLAGVSSRSEGEGPRRRVLIESAS